MLKKDYRLYLTLGFILAAAGCTLEEPFMGEICGNSENPLSFTIYHGERCDAANCHNKDDCCGIEEADARKLMVDAFKHNTCPTNSSYSKCMTEGDVNFCS